MNPDRKDQPSQPQEIVAQINDIDGKIQQLLEERRILESQLNANLSGTDSLRGALEAAGEQISEVMNPKKGPRYASKLKEMLSDIVREAGKELSQKFDFYICREYGQRK